MSDDINSGEPRSLLQGFSEGFDNEGKRLLAKCPEFSLFEMFSIGGERHVERSTAVERAYLKGMFRIINREKAARSTEDERIDCALAISSLARFTASLPTSERLLVSSSRPLSFEQASKGCGGNAAAVRMAATLGMNILELQNAKDVKTAIDDCAALFATALRGWAASQGLLTDGRSKSITPIEVVIIRYAEASFLDSLQRPKKSEIRDGLNRLEASFKKNDIKGAWTDAFLKAGLGDLPE